DQSMELQKQSRIVDVQVTAAPHRTLNTIRGVPSEDDLLHSSEEEILEGLRPSGVVADNLHMSYPEAKKRYAFLAKGGFLEVVRRGLAPPSEPRPSQVPSGNREAVAQPPPTKKPEVVVERLTQQAADSPGGQKMFIGQAFSACKSFCRTSKPAEEKQKWNCGMPVHLRSFPEAMLFSDLGLFELLLALLRAWRSAPPWDCQTGWCR
ncbi:hypothetical protein HPB47_018230, partial [Ixodes persulcatus]